MNVSIDVEKLSQVFDGLRELQSELNSHQYDLREAESVLETARQNIEDAESTVFSVAEATGESMERVTILMSHIEQFTINLVPDSDSGDEELVPNE